MNIKETISEIRLINAELRQIKKRLIVIKDKLPVFSVESRLLDSPGIHIDKCNGDLDTLIRFKERGQKNAM